MVLINFSASIKLITLQRIDEAEELCYIRKNICKTEYSCSVATMNKKVLGENSHTHYFFTVLGE